MPVAGFGPHSNSPSMLPLISRMFTRHHLSCRVQGKILSVHKAVKYQSETHEKWNTSTVAQRQKRKKKVCLFFFYSCQIFSLAFNFLGLVILRKWSSMAVICFGQWSQSWTRNWSGWQIKHTGPHGVSGLAPEGCGREKHRLMNPITAC